jgi:hypothetical protein
MLSCGVHPLRLTLFPTRHMFNTYPITLTQHVYIPGHFLAWSQNGTMTIPSDYLGTNDLSSYVWADGGKQGDSCASWDIPENCVKFYFAKEDSADVISPYFYAISFDATKTKNYKWGLNMSYWSGGIVNGLGDLIVTASVTINDGSSKQPIGVVGGNISMASLQSAVESSTTDRVNGTRIYAMECDANMRCKLLAASISGVSIQGGEMVNVEDVSDSIIRETSSYLIQACDSNGDFPTGVMHYENWFVQSETVTAMGGIDLRMGHKWIFVYVQPILCLAGWHINNVTNDCDLCEYPYTSLEGNGECNLCVEGYYYYKDECIECMEHATCLGGDFYPYPKKGYFMDRSKNKFANHIYRCELDTCPGFKRKLSSPPQDASMVYDDDLSNELLSCWTSDNYDTTTTDSCNSDMLQCAKGSFGPLCGSCQEEYTLYVADRKCIRCNSMKAIVPAVVLVFIFIMGILILMAKGEQQKNKQQSSSLPPRTQESFSNGPTRSFGSSSVSSFNSSSSFKFMETFIVSNRNRNRRSEKDWRVLYCLDSLYDKMTSIPPFNMIKDRATCKVVWSTAQIIATVSWNLSVRFPAPFNSFIDLLSFFQLDVISVSTPPPPIHIYILKMRLCITRLII